MKNIINDFKHFIDLCGQNLWVPGDGLEENFKLYVDNEDNQLDSFLNTDYEGTPLWFYFLSFDYSFFDYFKERISLKTDWDYTLLFNVDFIESSKYFSQLSEDFYYHKLNVFCPLSVLANILRKSEHFHNTDFSFTFPSITFQKIIQASPNEFFHNAKIHLNLSSLSHVLENDYDIAMKTIHSIMNHKPLKETFLSSLSETRNEDFSFLKINFFFNYPHNCPHSFNEKINPNDLKDFVTEVIYSKKQVDKKLLFQLMNKEHLILAIKTDYFSLEELPAFVSDKEIHYRLLDYKFPPTGLSTKKNKI